MVVALVMAGGRAVRLGGATKPLLRVCGRELLEHVVSEALKTARAVVVTVAGGSQRIVARRASDLLADPLYTPGEGYAVDLSVAIRCLRPRPLLVLPADTPFIRARLLAELVREATRMGRSVVTVRRRDGGYTGISVILGVEPSDWADITVADDGQLLDVDDLYSLAEALSRCSGP